ncbi:hypothetical protein PsorP6_017679 [Peronosclerospora sorghi]|uniref:Uncharacterized protein n=1 Tax=Peronosclerospora sorghi TaxID=230839 RepID=A0ACC0WLY6_9STRA|nr:hypothetical protein PsorP6_017679 [Peronosclerospora sorghi]
MTPNDALRVMAKATRRREHSEKNEAMCIEGARLEARGVRQLEAMSTLDFSTRLEQEECPSRCIPIRALLLAVKNAELEKKGESIEGLDWVALHQEHKQAGKRLARLSTVVKQAADVHQNAKDQTRQSSCRRSDWRWCWRQTETRGRGRFQSCTARKTYDYACR